MYKPAISIPWQHHNAWQVLDQLQASDRKQDIRYPSEMFLSTRNGRLGRMALQKLMSLLTEAESEGQLL